MDTTTYRYREALTADYLQREYIDHGRLTSDIANEVGCDIRVVVSALQRHGFEQRPRATTKGRERPKWADILTNEYLAERYVDQEQTLAEIAKAVGCSAATVRRSLERHGIPRRDSRKTSRLVYDSSKAINAPSDRAAARQIGMSHSAASRSRRRQGIEPKVGAPRTAVDLDRLYALADAGASLTHIADQMGVSRSLVWRRIKERRAPKTTKAPPAEARGANRSGETAH